MEPDALGQASPEPGDDHPDGLVFEPPYRPEIHDLTGATHAENIRIACARVELLDCLSDNPQFLDRLTAWAHRIGLVHATDAFAEAGEALARHLGLEHRSDLWHTGELAATPQTPDASAEELFHGLVQASEQWRAAVLRMHELLDSAVAYVRDELQLDWPWLAMEMLDGLLFEVYQHAIGVKLVNIYRLDPPDPEVAPFEYTFQPRPGETRRAAQQRLLTEAQEAAAQMRAATPDTADVPVGRLRKDLEDTMRRYTRWFYRHRFCQETSYQIAKTYHSERDLTRHTRPFPQCSCLRNVLDGMKEAERVLGLTPYFFRPSNEE